MTSRIDELQHLVISWAIKEEITCKNQLFCCGTVEL